MTPQDLGNVLLSGGGNDEPTESPKSSRWTPWLFTAIAISVLFFCRHSLLILYDTFSYREDWQHGFLIPIVSAYAAYSIFKRKGFPSSHPWRFGVAGIFGGATLVLLGEWYELFIGNSLGGAPLCAAGVIGMLTSLVLAFGGWNAALTYRFPLLYLLFGIPWPMGLVNAISRPLRQLASAMAEPTFRALSMPVLREGNLFHFATLSMGMEDACSGIRSLGVMLAASVAIAYFSHATIGGGLVLVVSATVCAILANYLRVVLTGVLGTLVDPIWATDTYHEGTGYATFVLGFAALMLLARFLPVRSRETDGKAAEAALAVTLPGKRKSAWRIVATSIVCAVVLLGAWARAALVKHYVERAVVVEAPPRVPLEDLPMDLGAFRCTEVDELLDGERRALQPSDAAVRTYTSESGAQLHCRILYWSKTRREYSWRHPERYGEWIGPHSPDACYTAVGWERDTRFPSPIRVGGSDISYRVFNKPAAGLVNLFWAQRQMQDQLHVIHGTKGKIAALVASLHEPAVLGHQYQYSVAIDVAIGGEGVQHATKLATSFAELLLEHLPEHGIPPPTQEQE